MRLLELVDGELRLTRELFRDIPEYAILSHTWGADGDEVTYLDISQGDAVDKAGYAKIRFCAEQARRDGLQYCWVDSCCIDRSSSSELAEAITSMFRWYKKAKRCYVYLSNFPRAHPDDRSPPWEEAFRAHRWFTRGWTLQELLAPSCVEFFTPDGRRLGDKVSLERHICDITGIPAAALRGANLSSFDIDQRFRWTGARQTTREEDEAYCLLGLFGVSMLPNYGEGKAKALRRLRAEIATAAKFDDWPTSTAPQTPPPSSVIPFMVPFEQNLSFTGREAELDKIHQMLSTSTEGGQMRTVAISGLGGVGKTQIALELVHQIKAKDATCSIFWIPATSMESINQGFLEIAWKLGLEVHESQEADVKKLVQDHLNREGAGRWTLLFDNADDIGTWTEREDSESARLLDYLPKSKRGSIVFTTRDRQAASKFAGPNVLEVFEMSEAGGLAMLRNSLIRKEMAHGDEASTLLARLTYLPLAIIQAAAYINAKGITLGEYVALLDAQEEDKIALLSEDFEAEGRYADIKNPVAVTWLISFQLMREREPLAADFLSFMACVDAKDIPRELLPLTESQKQNTDALGALQAYSFIATKTANTRITIHRLVHIALRNWLRREGLLEEWTRRAVDALITRLDDRDTDYVSVLRPFMPHAYYMLENNVLEDTEEKVLELETAFADCLFHEGRYADAERRYKVLVERNKVVRGAIHDDTLDTMTKLAIMYFGSGDLEAATQVQEKATAGRKSQPVRPFEESIRDAALLGVIYQYRQRWKESEKVLLEVLEFAKKSPKYHFYATVSVVGGLADVYVQQGEKRKARKLLEHEFARQQRGKLDTDDQDIISSMFSVADAYRMIGLVKEAEAVCLETLECQKEQSGEDSVHTAVGNVWLAKIYQDQRRLVEAERLIRESVATCEAKLGREHPETLDKKHSLASCWWVMGRREDAICTLEEVVEANTRGGRAKNVDSILAAESLGEYRAEVQRTGFDAPPELVKSSTRSRFDKLVSRIRDRI